MAGYASCCFAGDLLLSSEFARHARSIGRSPLYPLDGITPILQQADLVVVNLEGPIGRTGTPRHGATVLLDNDPVVLDWLKEFPICVCNLANNHIMDFGEEGLRGTMQALQQHGIHSIGAGASRQTAEEPLILTANKLRIGVLSYTTDVRSVRSVLAGPASAGCASFHDMELVLDRVKSLAGETDAVLVCLHWGVEYYEHPSPSQVEFARALAANGAVLIIGHHPHVLQGYEQRGPSLLAYSLGNLFLSPLKNPSGRIRVRKNLSRRIMLLNTKLESGRVAHYEFSYGKCTTSNTLQILQHGAAQRAQQHIERLSNALAHPSYTHDWAVYAANRERQLKREALWETFVKIVRTPSKDLLNTLSLEDLKRLARRFVGKAS
jgi:poly-gamma-glutamate capsule biosynthesis protein CapA/YwtB (metallophosphatase superfamily)